MRPLVKPACKEDSPGKPHVYSPYGSAKDELVAALGDFCSYCDWQVNTVALEVEHIEDKHNNPDLEEVWDNFLLACKSCNTIKGTKPINYSTMLFPHRQNTFGVIHFLEEGVVSINAALPDDLRERAEQTIGLVGLDRLPGHPDYSIKDKRWEYRMIVWEIANEYLGDYVAGRMHLKSIVDLAKARGFWSVWMQVFSGHTEVEDALIQNFKGTYPQCRAADINRR